MTTIDITVRLSKLTEKMFAANSDSKLIGEHQLKSPLPQPRQMVLIVQELKDLLFPGFWQEDNRSLNPDPIETGTHFDTVFVSLAKQIAFALEANSEALDGKSVGEFAAETTIEFLERLPGIRKVLATDSIAAFNGDPACQTMDEAILCYPGIQAITVHRMAHELYKMRVPLIPRMMAEIAHLETGIDIHPGAQIGDYFFVDHGTGVVIGETSIIGSHVKVYQGVTLGALSFPTNADGSLIRDVKRHPDIEDNVIIYANATVLGGNTTIGHDSVIGSNVWITSSVQPHTTVVMEKPKLRMRNEMEDELISSLNYQI